MKQFINEIKDYGLNVAWYNLKWQFCYWLLDATNMRVTTRK